ncbi:MAG: hypothetical protein M0C28_47730 [Candidatus Moduliflexus flocculans]|nr:hypothetical protein [Candidatus Moduliflexus flocculans]
MSVRSRKAPPRSSSPSSRSRSSASSRTSPHVARGRPPARPREGRLDGRGHPARRIGRRGRDARPTAGGFRAGSRTRMDKEKNGRMSRLYLTDLATNREIPLTRGTDMNGTPKWSPNGEGTLAFLSAKPLPRAQSRAGPLPALADERPRRRAPAR